jgi:hypothetical protein
MGGRQRVLPIAVAKLPKRDLAPIHLQDHPAAQLSRHVAATPRWFNTGLAHVRTTRTSPDGAARLRR